MIIHPIPPLYDENSKILILGSFPSVKSREEGFFYGHKQNRFWRVISRICNSDLPISIEEKREMILKNHIALWDVIKSCEIVGSSDSSITNVTPNDLSEILSAAKITHIFTNGKKSDSLYKKYIEEETGIEAVCLPSTSPANAAWSESRLFDFWNAQIADKLK